MILDHGTTPLKSLNPLDAVAFGIEINEFTFDLLIKKLYSNPIHSIVRELVSNAWDSHTAAGRTDIPVTVNAPTVFDPYFTVQDYGTGLSHEDMTTLYSTICRSDRRDSNSFLGGFGLGSKSPYSYTDQFTVEARFNGWKRLYALYKNENNIPTISLMDTTATDEHNGLTVRIPVASRDHYKFVNAIHEELLFFPNLTTNTPQEKPTPLWASDDGTITVTKATPYFNSNLYAVVGHVIYRVPRQNLFQTDTVELTADWNWKGNLFIQCEIGQLSITPNREDLQYNAHTTTYLENAVLHAQKTIQDHVKTAIPLCPTYNAACKQFGPLRVVLDSMGWWSPQFTHPERPGEILSSYITISLDDDVDAAITDKTRRGPLKIDHWVDKNYIKLRMDAEYTLLWCPKKTPYIAERLRQLNETRTCIVLRGGDRDALVAHFNAELLSPVTSHDLSHYPTVSRARAKNSGGTWRLINGDPIHYDRLNPQFDSFVRMDGTMARYRDKAYSLSLLTVGQNTLACFQETRTDRFIVQIPKSRWNCKLTKEYREAIPHILEKLTLLIATYTDDLKTALVINQIPHRYDLVSLADAYRYNHQDSPFFKGLQRYQSTPTKITNLIHAAIAFDLPLPEADPQAVETAKAFYERYRPFIDYRIDCDTHPRLIVAYEHYLELLGDV